MGERPTIGDVAARAGVGVGTVSRVLNDSRSVSEDTRERVLRAMRDLDYRPNRRARALSTGRSQSVAVIAPFATEPSVVERLRGISQALHGSDHDLILLDVATPDQRDRQYRAVAAGDRFDGLLPISLAPTDDEVKQLTRAGLPTVLLDCEHPDLPRTVIDDVRGGMLATRHLLQLGHRRIAFMGETADDRFRFTASARRREGCELALKAHGLTLQEPYVRVGPHGRAVAHRLTDELLALPERPSAIVTSSDTQALGVLEAAASSGVRIPEELSVVGFDDLDVAAYVGLTTVRQPLRASGEIAARLLLERIDRPLGDPVEQVLELEVVPRRTTTAVRV
ncbi:LacI family DNA-binding transcriptional regulator [Streptomyces roseochromogenus]|uniref:Transcriptional regulator n=1 Tax=Streptomyces roseochromogenus subsp. oscitans DS 12.976 TaxID=1352936 RepID=V6KSK9_STRRC|nr:LacI family DNA-binding transcriptional regulator [Streptomyces roseochromogenus]EST34396.1 transcriptional regulator [Streptomyces roseochromogenus subsp. oscitans DS 12.976]